MTKHDENSSLDPRLERLLADCLEAEERGEPLDESALLRSHPEFANELASFFDNRRAIGRLAERLCAQELSTAGIDALHDKSANDSLVGRTFGDYELTREVARGGMGVVYAARHRTLQRTVALKMILAGRAASSVDLARFRQEAEAAARLDHPHIVPVYEVGEHDGFCYFTMKLLDGGNLHRHLDSLKGNARRAARLVEQLARAVHFAHQHGILHRDLKPANILLDEAGEPYVADFGLARVLDSQNHMTQTGAALGTPGYMAPEQIRGERSLTTAVDVYSLGAILFVCLTGRAPFQSENAWDALQMALHSDPPTLRSIDSRVDRDLETICRKALDREPARRYESAAAFADDLARWLRHEPIEARPPGLVQRLKKWTRRHPALAIGAVATLLAFVVGAVQLRLTWVALRGERIANERAESLLYRSLLSLAEREWMAGSTETARETLNGCPEAKRGWEWQYARRLCQITPANVWSELEHPIVGGGYSADGRKICTIDSEGRAVAYDILGRKLAQASVAARNANAHATLSADGARWALAGADEVVVYDLAGTDPLWRAAANGDPLQVGFSPSGNLLACLSLDEVDGMKRVRLRIWKSGGNLLHDLPLERSREIAGNFFYFESDERLLVHPQIPPDAKVAEHGAPAVFNPQSGERLAMNMLDTQSDTSSVPWPEVAPAAMSGDGKWLAYAYPYGRSRVEARRVTDGRTVVAPVAGGSPFAYAFSPDGRMMAFAMNELNVNLDAIPRNQPLPEFVALASALGANQQTWIFTVYVVELEKGKELCALRGLRGNQIRLEFSPDSRRLLALGGAAASSDRAITKSFGVISQWEVPARQTARVLQANDSPIEDVAVTPDGLYAVAGGGDRVLRVWEIATGRLVRELAGHTVPIQSIAVGNDPRKIVTVAGWEGFEWNLETGESRVLRANNGKSSHGEMHFVAMHPDSQRIALPRSDHEGKVEQFLLPDMRKEWSLEGRGQFPAYSRDGTLIAIPYQFDLHGELKIVESANGRVVHHFKSNPHGLSFRLGWGYLRAAFSPDGRFVAAVGNTGGVDLYDLKRRTLVREMRGHGTTVWDVAFSADGSRIATSGYDDKTVKLWSTETGEEMHTLRGHEATVTGLAFSPDDARLITADRGGVLRVWESRDSRPTDSR